MVLVFLFFYNLSPLFPQGTSKIDSLFSFYPAHVGNKWFYKVSLTSSVGDPSSTLFCSREIMEDTMINNLTYKKILNLWDVYHYKEKSFTYERLDSASGKLFLIDYYNKEAEMISDFSMKDRDVYSNGSSILQFMGNSDREFMNQIIAAKSFYHQKYSLSRSFTYYKQIGLGNYTQYMDFTEASYSLVWCKLNGVYYGDTLQTRFSKTEELPLEFKLSQNYPNPFNPTTTINYSILKRSIVTLKIYDILGRELAALINEEKDPGNYKINFDGTLLPSGIYLYKIICEKYSDAEKMILIKYFHH